MSARSHDPFTGARVTSHPTQPGAPRLGVPEDKMGTAAGIPFLTPDKRQGVLLMLFPPEQLRDQPLDVIEQVIARQSQGLMKTIALEIYKSFTSDPVDVSAAQNVISAMQGHVEAMRQGGR